MSSNLYLAAATGVTVAGGYLLWRRNQTSSLISTTTTSTTPTTTTSSTTTSIHKPSKNLYLSFDIEADGPAPSVNNMMSIGIWGFNGDGDEVVSYQRNLKDAPGHVLDVPTKERFWDKNPEALAFVQKDQVEPQVCMKEIADMYNKYKEEGYRITWVARPAAYDWQWVNCYYNEFGPLDKPNIGFSCSCISTAYWLYCQQNGLSKQESKALWNELKGDEEVTHNPLDDARCQGKILLGLMKKYGIKL